MLPKTKLLSYSRQFIQNYSQEALPILRFLEGKKSKHDKIDFDKAAVQAFQKLKQLLSSAPVLAYPVSTI